MPFQVAALLAASSWAVGGLVAAEPSRLLGGPRFVRLRMVYVTIALTLIGLVVGGWSTIEVGDWLPLGISGFVGLAFGDDALFEAFSRLGPRRTGMLFAANAPIAAVLSAIVSEERFGWLGILGTVLVVAGVSLAIAYGTRPGQSHTWEEVRGPLWVGISFGLLGALGQAIADVAAVGAGPGVWNSGHGYRQDVDADCPSRRPGGTGFDLGVGGARHPAANHLGDNQGTASGRSVGRRRPGSRRDRHGACLTIAVSIG
jgi:drug/metabolite transporter (DMT)-like permease